MRALLCFSPILLFLALLANPVPAQEDPRPNPDLPGQEPSREEDPGQRDDRPQGRERPVDPTGDVPAGDDGATMDRVRVETAMANAVDVQAFTDPQPLPRGGTGHIYLNLHVHPSGFVTRGRQDTRFTLPKKLKHLDFGKPQWPAPAGRFVHSETGRKVPGWVGQYFIKIPVTVSSSAPLGAMEVELKGSYRVLSKAKPFRAGGHQPVKQVLKLQVGPPLPAINFPVRAGARRSAGTVKPPAPLRAGGQAETGRNAKNGVHEPGLGGASEGVPDVDPMEEEILGLEEGSFFQNKILVLGLAGLLVLVALLLLFRGRS